MSSLFHEGGKHKSWRRRWFILTDNCLYYFKTPHVSLVGFIAWLYEGG